MKKLDSLRQTMSKLVQEGLCLAFSGGVDSSLLLKIACEEGEKQHKKVFAVTFQTRLHPAADLDIARTLSHAFGAVHAILEIDELENEMIKFNPVNRCYLCKKQMFEHLLLFAKQNKIVNIADGTNADDVHAYRPGIAALRELGVISPLMDLGITKEEVRLFAKELQISVASRPSAPCLATRLPYGQEIDFLLFQKIEQAEEKIKALGFINVRLRAYGDTARLEIDKEQMQMALEQSDILVQAGKDAGFTYVTLDLEGFRSGSMDINLGKEDGYGYSKTVGGL